MIDPKSRELTSYVTELLKEGSLISENDIKKRISEIATDKLLDLQQKLKDVNEEKEKKGPNNVTNALFVGSTADLAKLIKQQDTKSD